MGKADVVERNSPYIRRLTLILSRHTERRQHVFMTFFGQSFELRVEKERREAIERNFLGSVISIKISILVVF